MNDSVTASAKFLNRFKASPQISPELMSKLRFGEDIDDERFDRIFSPHYHIQSSVHWSPIEVARQIALWIAPLDVRRFVDIGCGVGKLCLLMRILSNHEVYGIEQRPKLVKVANKIIRSNHFKNIHVIEKNMMDLKWNDFDIYYLFNPFQEHLFAGFGGALDQDVEFDAKTYCEYTTEVFKQLNAAKRGKFLITYDGYGGETPPRWRKLAEKRIDNGDLIFWVND